MSPPVIDLAYYAARAKNSTLPSQPGLCAVSVNSAGGDPAQADPPGSGFIPSGLNGNPGVYWYGNVPLAYPFSFRNSTSVVYIDNDGISPTMFWMESGLLDVEALILGGETSLYVGAGMVMGATIPATAALEYAHPLAVPIWSQDNPPYYPGFGFRPSFSSVGAGNCCYPLLTTVHGFVYIGGTLTATGALAGAIHGTVYMKGDKVLDNYARDVSIYYDTAVGGRVRLKNGPIRRSEWKEVSVPW